MKRNVRMCLFLQKIKRVTLHQLPQTQLNFHQLLRKGATEPKMVHKCHSAVCKHCYHLLAWKELVKFARDWLACNCSTMSTESQTGRFKALYLWKQSSTFKWNSPACFRLKTFIINLSKSDKWFESIVNSPLWSLCQLVSFKKTKQKKHSLYGLEHYCYFIQQSVPTTQSDKFKSFYLRSHIW